MCLMSTLFRCRCPDDRHALALFHGEVDGRGAPRGPEAFMQIGDLDHRFGHRITRGAPTENSRGSGSACTTRRRRPSSPCPHFGAPSVLNPFIAADKADNSPEDQGFDQAVPDVLNLRVVDALVHVGRRIGSRTLTPQSTRPGCRCTCPTPREEHHDRARQEPRHHKVLHRVRGERIEGIRSARSPASCPVRTAMDAPARPATHEPRQHRSEFPGHGERHHCADERLRAETV